MDRICPGRYFALAGLFINIASVLHVFNIGPPLDEEGSPIRIAPEMTDSLMAYVTSSSIQNHRFSLVSHRYATDFRCKIEPRSAWGEALILAQANEKVTAH